MKNQSPAPTRSTLALAKVGFTEPNVLAIKRGGTLADASLPVSIAAIAPAGRAKPRRTMRFRSCSRARGSRLRTVPTGNRSFDAACS